MDREFASTQIADSEASSLRDVRRRGRLAFVASVVAHAIILAALVWMLPEARQPQHQWVLAYLVELDQIGSAGKGAGAGDAHASSLPAPAHEASALKSQSVISSLKPHAHRRAAHARAMPVRAALPQTAAISATPVPGDAAIAARSEGAAPANAGTAPSRTGVASATAFGSGADGAGGGHGNGVIGDGAGSSFAHVEYGRNPVPTYPIEARRRAQHGTVLLRIEVVADGSVERVELAHSSGFDLLDDSAIETVRMRWRFVAARRDGVAVESWCEVPIRFALTEAEAR
jgi:protein TonB